jgi:hypothetical protein
MVERNRLCGQSGKRHADESAGGVRAVWHNMSSAARSVLVGLLCVDSKS